jgi:hypothetical protein
MRPVPSCRWFCQISAAPAPPQWRSGQHKGIIRTCICGREEQQLSLSPASTQPLEQGLIQVAQRYLNKVAGAENASRNRFSPFRRGAWRSGGFARSPPAWRGTLSTMSSRPGVDNGVADGGGKPSTTPLRPANSRRYLPRKVRGHRQVSHGLDGRMLRPGARLGEVDKAHSADRVLASAFSLGKR